MAFSNPVTATGTATAQVGGVNVVTTSEFPAPSANQLAWVVLRTPALTTPSTPPTVLLTNALSVTLTTMTAIGTPVEIGTSGTLYQQTYYAQTVGTERFATATWVGTAASAAPTQAVIEYDEFDGFSGTPTLDLSQTGSSPSNAAFAGLSTTTHPVATTELAIQAVSVGNTSGAWQTGSSNSVFKQNTSGGTGNFTFTDGNSTSYQNVGWVQPSTMTLTPSLNNSWTVTWTTSRAWGSTAVTFYDLTGTTVTAGLASVSVTANAPTTPITLTSGLASVSVTGEPPTANATPTMATASVAVTAEPPTASGTTTAGLASVSVTGEAPTDVVTLAAGLASVGVTALAPNAPVTVGPGLATVTVTAEPPSIAQLVAAGLASVAVTAEVPTNVGVLVAVELAQVVVSGEDPTVTTPPITSAYPPWIVVDGQLAWHVAGIWYMRI